jgi:hypothetical protein
MVMPIVSHSESRRTKPYILSSIPCLFKSYACLNALLNIPCFFVGDFAWQNTYTVEFMNAPNSLEYVKEMKSLLCSKVKKFLSIYAMGRSVAVIIESNY